MRNSTVQVSSEMPADNGTDNVMRAKDVAAFMGCSISTVWKWVEQGLLPKPSRLGTRFSFWRKSQIEAALAKAGRE